MNFLRNSCWIGLVIFIAGLFSIQRVFAQKSPNWRIKNRLQTGYEFDNNIRESSSDSLNKTEDSSLRFLFHSQASRVSARTRINFSYKGGLQTYFNESIENKLINEFDLNSGLKIQKWVVGLRGSGRLKIYLNDDLDYSTGSVEGYIQPPALLNFKYEVAVKLSGLSYQNFSVFSYAEKQIGLAVSRQLVSRLNAVLEFSGKKVFYDRSVLQATLANPVDFFEIKLRDETYKFKIGLNYSKSFLFNLHYTFQRNNSTSKVFEYNRHQFVFTVAYPLPKNIWLRGYAAAQIKNYFEDSLPVPLRDIDTERDESNFFIVDLSKDLSTSLNALLRFAYYNNESIIRSRFYSKSILTMGFDYRF